MNDAYYLPVPYMKIERSFRIIEQSHAATERFAQTSSLLELVDIGSKEKAAQFLQPSYSNMQIELNFMTLQERCSLFEVYQRWEDEKTAHLLLVEKQPHLQNIEYAVHELREQISRIEKPAVHRPELGLVNTLSQRQASAQMDNRMAIKEALHALDTVKELVMILRPSLLEAGKDLYVNLIIDHLHQAMESLGK
ncbi:hypothetical protein [Paenibacillus hexagrammi]|uniref:Uncharacterized protein n=1 Tax=Paenibacillus hexagrammi TaxID=2908839 RepID=A0ABY3SJW5_9BACL|nr:hypothetical protein [Paenibacillus sp. YPD9-1]UJF34113.1 hypothetical protein L0M14_02420 [Paenibacillus sp. YPD9-1]